MFKNTKNPCFYGAHYDSLKYVKQPTGISGALRRCFGLSNGDIVLVQELIGFTKKGETSCWVSHRTLAERTGLHKTQVKRCIDHLVSVGAVSKQTARRKGRPTTGSPIEDWTNHYDLGGLRAGLFKYNYDLDKVKELGVNVAVDEIEKAKTEMGRLQEKIDLMEKAVQSESRD